MPTITVIGNPAAQGSKAFKGISKRTGRAILVEQSKAVKPWRTDVSWAWCASGHAQVPGAVAVTIHFWMQRPKRTNQKYPVVKDIDKLVRSTFDALTQAGAIEDDSRVVSLTATKTYAIRHTGAQITIEAMD